MLQELKTATNDDMKSEIQRRLEEAEKKIRKMKDGVDYYERQVNQRDGELKKEGEFSVSITIMTLYIQHAITGAKTCEYCHDKHPMSDISWTVLTGEFPSTCFQLQLL